MGKADKRLQRRIKDVRAQAFDLEIKQRAAQRTCGECGACDGATLCGWRKGLFLQAHRPDTLGLRLIGADLQGVKGTVTAWIFHETQPDARKGTEASTLLHQAARAGRVVLVVDPAGVWAWMGGPARLLRVLVGDDSRLPHGNVTCTADLLQVEEPDQVEKPSDRG